MGEYLRAEFARQHRAPPVPVEPHEPVTALRDLDVVLNRTPIGIVYVELVDPRCGLKLVSLNPQEAANLAGKLVVASGRARVGDPGE